jgi:hypothetical protein
MLNITTKPKPLPPRILLYGVPGIGKTTMGSRFPKALLIPVEDGADNLDIARTDKPADWGAFLAILEELSADTHGYATLVIDSLSALQELLFAHVCVNDGVKSIELAAGGFGKGYLVAADHWRGMLAALDKLRAKGMVVVGIGHMATIAHQDPRLPNYDRMQPRLHVSGKGQGILPHTVEWCDVVACCAYEVYTTEQGSKSPRGLGDGNRIMYLQERPAYLAKNRYGLPEQLPMDASALLAAIKSTLATNKE